MARRDRKNITLSPVLEMIEDEADAMGLPFTRLVSADLTRFRELAGQAEPQLSGPQWELLCHVLDGVEAMHILTGRDDLPTAGRIAAEVADWIGRHDPAIKPAPDWALDLYQQIPSWSALAVYAVLLRVRRDAIQTRRIEPKPEPTD